MNSHIVEKTMHSIKNIDRLTDLAAIDVYNTTHDTINKYEIMKEHATEEYTNESFYQESVLAGVLIGAGILGVAISAFFIIKKIIDTKAAGDSSVKSSDGGMISEQIDLRDPKSVQKYIEATRTRLKKLDPNTKIKLPEYIDSTALAESEKKIQVVVDKFDAIIDNKDNAEEIKKIIGDLNTEELKSQADQAFPKQEKEVTPDTLIDALGIEAIAGVAQLLNTLKTKIDKVEKSVNKNKSDKNENVAEISDEDINKLKEVSKKLTELVDSLVTSVRQLTKSIDLIIEKLIKSEAEAKKKTEEAKEQTNPVGTGAAENKTETDKSKPEVQPSPGAGSGADDKGETKKQQTPEEQARLQKNTSALIAIKNALSKYLSADECEKIQSEIFHEVHDEDGTGIKDILMRYHNDIKSNPAKYHVSSVDDAELVMGNIHKMAMTLIDNCKIMYDPKVAEKAEIYITGNNLSEITTFNNADFNQGEPKADESKAEEPKVEEPKIEESKAEEPATEEQPKQISPEDRQIIDEIKDLIKANNSVTDASILLRMMSSHAKATDSQIKSCTAIAREELKNEPQTEVKSENQEDKNKIDDRQIIDEIKGLLKSDPSISDSDLILKTMTNHAGATSDQIKSCIATASKELKAENPPTPTENSEYPDDALINEKPEFKEGLINDLADYMKQYPDQSDDEAFQVRGFNTLKISPEMAKELKTSARELANKGSSQDTPTETEEPKPENPSEPEKKPEDQVKTEPENPPTPTDQTSSDDEKITKLANELYHAPTDDNKRVILMGLNRLREGESSVITHLNNVKTSALVRIKNGQQSLSMSQAILDKIVYNYEAIAKEFGINVDYLNSYDKTIPTEAPNDNAKQVTYGNDGEIIINGKNTGVKKSWSDDMNERAEKMISYLGNDYNNPATITQDIFTGGGPSGDLKTRLNNNYQYWINRVKDGKTTPEEAIKHTSAWHDMLLNLARGLGEDENLPPVPDFKAMAPSNAETKSENENKEKAKPTASDFENFKNPEVNPESQQRFNSEINNADKSSTQSVQSDGAALKQQADAKEAAAKEVNKYQSNINGTLSSDSEENKAAQWIANAQSHDQEGDSGSNLGTNFLNAVRNGKAKMNEQPSTEELKTSEAPAAPETSGRLIPSALSQDEVETIRNSIVHEFTVRNYPSTFAEQLADIIIDKYDGDVVKYAIDGYNNAKGKNAQQIKTNKGKIYNRAIILANIFDIPEDEIPKPDEKIETTNTEQQNSGVDVETNQEKTPDRQKISDEASQLNEPDIVDIDSITSDIKNGKSEADITKSLTDRGYSQADAIRHINMAKEDIAETESNPVPDDEERAAQWIANANANGGSQNTQPTVQSVQGQDEETTPTLGTNFLNAVRNGKAKMNEQPAQTQPAQPQPEVSQDTTNPGPDDEERAAQWIANAKANEAPETPATPAADSTNNDVNYGANWLNYMQQARKENEINNNINYLRDEGYNNDQIRDLLANQGYDRNDVNTVLNMSDDQLKAIQDAINNNNTGTITSQDHDAVPAPPQLPKKLPLEPETHIDLDAAAPANEAPAGVNQVNINDAEETAKNNYLNTRIAKNPKLGYPSLEALNNAVDELIAMIKQNVAIGNDPSQYAVGVLHNIYNIASAKNKMALPFDKLAALKAVKQYIKYRMIKQGVGNYFAEMTENDIGYYNLIQEYKIEIIREEKLKMIQEQQG